MSICSFFSRGIGRHPLHQVHRSGVQDLPPSLYIHLLVYIAPHGGGSNGGLSWKKSHKAGEKNDCNSGDMCGNGGDRVVGPCSVLLTLFGVFVDDLFVTLDCCWSGSWYCDLRLSANNDQVPIGEPFMLYILTAGGRGKHGGLSISHSLADCLCCHVPSPF